MWSRLTSRVSDEHINALLARVGELLLSTDTKAVNFEGKGFFTGEEDNNFDVLRLIHLDVWPEISDSVGFDDPVIDHAILLIKQPGGAGTRLHQDSAYWVGREDSPTVFSVWIALEDVSPEKGGLLLSAPNQVGVSDMSTFNSGSTLEHEQVDDPEGGFPLLITAPVASQLAETMEQVNLGKGEAVAFDSYEPHMSGPNLTKTPRLAMKIAYADGLPIVEDANSKSSPAPALSGLFFAQTHQFCLFVLRSSPYPVGTFRRTEGAGGHQDVSLVFCEPFVVVGIVIAWTPGNGMRAVFIEERAAFAFIALPWHSPMGARLCEDDGVAS